MRRLLLSLFIILTSTLASGIARANSNITAFPPENCTEGLTMYMGWDGVHSTTCNSGQDIFRQTLGCSEGQQVVYEGGKYTCKTVVTLPACGANEVLTFDGTGFFCVDRTDSIPTCDADQFLTYNGSDFQCANTQKIAPPTCGGNQYVWADGVTFSCRDFPSVASVCPDGETTIPDQSGKCGRVMTVYSGYQYGGNLCGENYADIGRCGFASAASVEAHAYCYYGYKVRGTCIEGYNCPYDGWTGSYDGATQSISAECNNKTWDATKPSARCVTDGSPGSHDCLR